MNIMGIQKAYCSSFYGSSILENDVAARRPYILMLLSVEGKRRLLCDVCCFMAKEEKFHVTLHVRLLTSCHVIATKVDK